MNPFINPTLTGLKEESHDFLERIDFKVEENKQEFIFHSSEVGFPPTTIASLAGFLDDVLVVPVGMVGHFKVCQEFFKLCLIQACKGTECTRVVFELLIREHGGYLQSGVFDFSVISYSLL